MLKIPQDISDYIDYAIERERKIFNEDLDKIDVKFTQNLERVQFQFKKDMEHNNGALMEGFRHEIELIAEFVDSKPGREEVREVIQEEIKSAEAKIDLVIEEIRDLRESFDSHMVAYHK